MKNKELGSWTLGIAITALVGYLINIGTYFNIFLMFVSWIFAIMAGVRLKKLPDTSNKK